jgi:hypothetical protein
MSEACEAILLCTPNSTYSSSVVFKATEISFPVVSGNHGKLHGRTSTGCVFRSTILYALIVISYKLKFSLEAYFKPYPTVPRVLLLSSESILVDS